MAEALEPVVCPGVVGAGRDLIGTEVLMVGVETFCRTAVHGQREVKPGSTKEIRGVDEDVVSTSGGDV